MSHLVENLELAALKDLHAAADRSDVENLGIHAVDLGSTFVSIAAALPPSAIVVNRSLGSGLSAAMTRAEVDDIVAVYAEHGVDQYFVQIHPAAEPAELRDWLKLAGLKADRAWQKFARADAVVEPRSSTLQVREIDAEHGHAFAEIVCPAFDLGDAAIPWLAKLPGRPDWHIFMSFDGATPAGVGALYLRDGYGWTDWGATASRFRQRGSQGAIMAARLQRASELGCSQVFTCTGVSVAGDPQHSYNNILRAGFSETYVRENYVPA